MSFYAEVAKGFGFARLLGTTQSLSFRTNVRNLLNAARAGKYLLAETNTNASFFVHSRCCI